MSVINETHQNTQQPVYMKVSIVNLVPIIKQQATKFKVCMSTFIKKQKNKIQSGLLPQLSKNSILGQQSDLKCQEYLNHKKQNVEELIVQIDHGKIINQNDTVFAIYKDSYILFQIQQIQDDEIATEQKQGYKAYCQFSLKNLYKIPKVYHLLDITSINKYKASQQKVIEQLFEMQVQILIIHGFIGNLELFMIEGRLQRDTQLIGQMDPYMKITVGKQKYRTEVCQNSGKNPVWNIKIKIPINSVNEMMHLQVFDKDMTVDDLVGEKQVNLFQQKFLIPRKKLSSHPIYIFYKGKAVGKVEMQARFLLLQNI